MSSFLTPKKSFNFPERSEQVRGCWSPIYIEPMVGSGERICIGVAVVSGSSSLTVPVTALNRLECVYGKDVDSLMYASKLAIEALQSSLKGNGALEAWVPPFDGIYLGRVREGAGSSLEDIARVGITLCASLAEKIGESDEELARSGEGLSSARLEQLIKESVVAIKPGLGSAFDFRRQLKPDARPAIIGFVGQRIAANFGLLVPGYLSRHVENAKAKLWDLAQLQDDLTREALLAHTINRFEMLIHRVKDDSPEYTLRQIRNVHEAVVELEGEADKKSIRCRALTSPDEIAKVILDAEAA